MSKTMLILATVLTLPVTGVVLWMMTPAPVPIAVGETAHEGPASVPDAHRPTGASATLMAAAHSLADTSKIVRRSDQDFPEMQPSPPPAAPASPAPTASPRFSLATQPNAAVLIQQLRNNPITSNERIRVLPAEVVSADSTEPSAAPGPAPAGKTAPAAGAIVLQLDHSMHDPAAWVEGEKPLSEPLADLKDKIADEFAADVAAAVNTQAEGRALDDTWKDARARSNSQYQKFFGAGAANRGALNAGRAAVSKQ